MRVTEHFDSKEFNCRDGTEYPQSWIFQRLFPLCGELETIRTALGGRPITILSGYRTPEYNAFVGGATASQHVQGRAADIRVKGLKASAVHSVIYQLYKDKKIKIGGLGLYDLFCHVDIRTGSRLAMWYQEPGAKDV